MAWDDVLSKLVFPSVASTNTDISTLVDPEKSLILNYLEALYKTSAEAKSVLDSATASGVVNLVHSINDPGFQGSIPASGQRIIGLNLDLISRFHYINSTGTVVSETGSFAAISIIHEFIHLLSNSSGQPNDDPRGDDALMNGSSFDHKGDVLPIQNEIAVEKGWTKYQQASYFGGYIANFLGENRPELAVGTKFTEGNSIDVARLGDYFEKVAGVRNQVTQNIIDHSLRTSDINDLILSFSGVDIINAGSGRDYIYAGDGDDKIIGGAGDDLIHGGMLGGNAPNDGTDTADYSQNAPSQGISVLVDGDATEFDGLRTITVQDGQGGQDRLISIERITATAGADVFRFNGQFASDINLIIDAKGGPTALDSINLGNASNGFVISSNPDGSVAVMAKSGGGAVTLINFGNGGVVGSSFSDLILAEGLVDGGDGADLIMGGSVVNGGAGSDFIQGGAIIDGGAGNDFYTLVSAGTSTILLRAGGGHDVLAEGATATIDVGSGGLAGVSIAWEKTLVRTEHLIDGEIFVPYTVDYYEGRIAVVVDGASIAVGSVTAEFTNFGPHKNYWSSAVYDVRAVFTDGTGPAVGYQDLLQAIGLVDGYGQYMIPTAVADSSWFEAENEWRSAYTEANPTYSSGMPTAGDDTFIRALSGNYISYLEAAAGVVIDLGFTGRQNTVGSGFDQLVGIELLEGSNFSDLLTASSTVGSWLWGADGDDVLKGAVQNDFLMGDAGNDTIQGGGGDDYIEGGDGDDTIVLLGNASDYVFIRNSDGSVTVTDIVGDEGTDTLIDIEFVHFLGDNSTADLITLVADYGTPNDDGWLEGTAGNDALFGLDGDDTLIGRGGDDLIDGGAGDDTVVLAGSVANYTISRNPDGTVSVQALVGDEGVDRLVSIENVYFQGDSVFSSVDGLVGQYGTEDDDSWVDGTANADNLYGLDGDDTLVGRAGNDLLDGGDGFDQANYFGDFADFIFSREADGGISVVDTTGAEGSDTLFNIEAVYFGGSSTWASLNNLVADYGTEGDDEWVQGTAGSDRIYGLAGDDVLVGRDGDDFIYGGHGYDQANYFGSSTDFSFTLNPDGTVTVTDLVGDEGSDILTDVEALYFDGDDVWTTIEALVGGNGAASARVPTHQIAGDNRAPVIDFMTGLLASHPWDELTRDDLLAA